MSALCPPGNERFTWNLNTEFEVLENESESAIWTSTGPKVEK